MEDNLPWPTEQAIENNSVPPLWQPASNLCLDFHGDPLRAKLAVYSDGNHHMALQAVTELFAKQHPAVEDIFYATTPPNLLLAGLRHGAIDVGNLRLSRQPDVFISPLTIMKQLRDEGFVEDYQPFMQSRGNVLLIHKTNAKNITCIEDVLRDDVRLFISNPDREKASYQVYYQTLQGLLQQAGVDIQKLETKISAGASATVFGERIHHREAPQALYNDEADVAMVYYHLALRYTRIFPDLFDFIPLGGSKASPHPDPANVTTTFYVTALCDSSEWGERFVNFLQGDEAVQLYSFHGLSRPAGNAI